MILALLWITGMVHAQSMSQGAYLARAASCLECHTPPGAPDFSGGLALVTDFGTFFTPNITPDKETGIGNWKGEDFRRALREGVSPQHSYYYPAFPYRSFSKMTDEDMDEIFYYLQSVAPVKKFNRPHQLSTIFEQRWLVFGWQALFFRGPSSDPLKNIKIAEGPFMPDLEKPVTWNRGAYLVEAVLHCTECHTPRNFLGGLVSSQWMAGSDILFSGLTPPNITPDPESGITWSHAQWTNFLASGIDPKGTSPGVEMALAVRATSGLTRADREAVVEYLLSLDPVRRFSKGKVPQ